MTICEEEDIELHKDIHALDLKNNEWHIASMQIYENLFRDDANLKNQQGKLKFDLDGNLIEKEQTHNPIKEEAPSMGSAMRQFLEFIDAFRRRYAAPEASIVRKKYAKYADLDYIKNRLVKVESDVYKEIHRENQITVDYVEGQ